MAEPKVLSKDFLMEFINRGMNHMEIAREIGYDDRTVKKYMIRNGIEVPQLAAKEYTFSDNESELIINNYARMSASEIHQKFFPELSYHQISGQIKRLRKERDIQLKPLVRNHTHEYNERFFETPNNLNCYWAGFIAADGNINKRSEQLYIGLKIDDKNHLEKFVKDIGYSGPIVEKTIKRNNKVYYQCSIRICCKKICNDLWRNFNIGPKKSLILEPPKSLTLEQSLRYIKGYTDGDGQINIYKSTTNNRGLRFRIGWAGTKQMMEWIRENINKMLINPSKNKLRTLGKIKEYFFEGDRALRLAKILDKIDTPRMHRKWDKIKEWENIMAQFPLKKRGPHNFNEEEDKILIDNYYDKTLPEIHNILPYLTTSQIKVRTDYFKKLGILKNKNGTKFYRKGL